MSSNIPNLLQEIIGIINHFRSLYIPQKVRRKERKNFLFHVFLKNRLCSTNEHKKMNIQMRVSFIFFLSCKFNKNFFGRQIKENTMNIHSVYVKKIYLPCLFRASECIRRNMKIMKLIWINLWKNSVVWCVEKLNFPIKTRWKACKEFTLRNRPKFTKLEPQEHLHPP